MKTKVTNIYLFIVPSLKLWVTVFSVIKLHQELNGMLIILIELQLEER